MNIAVTERPEAKAGIFGHPAVDCDIHPNVPSVKALLPYVEEYWREQFINRGIDRLSFAMSSYPPNAPISARPDWKVQGSGPRAGTDLATLSAQALDTFGTSLAICNCLHGSVALHSEDMAAAFARAVNTWITKEWLDREPRLRASIVVPLESPELAVEEIERLAGDPRFVSVMLLAMGEKPLGRRVFWPIYAAAERHKMPIVVHAGSTYRHAPTAIGWPSYFLEDYVAQSAAFESQLLSFVSEGVFAKYPDLKVVFAESGFCWLPAFMWRANKTWRGVRMEVPWVKEKPADIVRRHVRVCVQPVDGPPQPGQLQEVIDQIDCDDMFLFSTDYPHWQFDGIDALPRELSGGLARKVLWDNPMATYPRLQQSIREVRR